MSEYDQQFSGEKIPAREIYTSDDFNRLLSDPLSVWSKVHGLDEAGFLYFYTGPEQLAQARAADLAPQYAINNPAAMAIDRVVVQALCDGSPIEAALAEKVLTLGRADGPPTGDGTVKFSLDPTVRAHTLERMGDQITTLGIAPETIERVRSIMDGIPDGVTTMWNPSQEPQPIPVPLASPEPPTTFESGAGANDLV